MTFSGVPATVYGGGHCCIVVPQELNNRLAAEITRLRTLLTGDGGGESTVLPLTQGKDAYELEVL